jgi:tetratricopeptide (TPR) repeat protein
LIFNFETNPIKVRMRLWALEPGEYELLLGPDADGDDKMDQAETQSKFAVHGRGTPIDFQLPPGNLYQLTVKLVTEFQGTQAARADIAVSPDDILVFPSRPAEGERALVLARIRNIGPEPAPKVLAAFSMGSRPDVTDQSKTVTVALDTPQGLWTTASWAWAELEAKGPKASFSVRAEIPDAKPASELTLENNQASRQITTGTETHAAFATIFLQGQLSQRLVPVWLDLAQVYESGAKASLPPERVGSLQKSLQDAAANAGEEELRLIRNLKTYLQELTSPEHRGTAATEPSKPSEMRAFFFDMGTPSSPLEREHIRVTEKTVFTPERGYGWEKPAEGSFDRPDSTPPSDLKRDGVFDSNDLTFRVAVKPGRYYIRVTVGDPGEPGKGQRLLREKMSIYIQNHPLSTNLTTDSNWWRGDATSLLVSGSVQLGEEIMEFRFFHEGTANSVQAIQILPDTGLEFNPGVERDKLPPSLDWAVFGPAIEAYQRKNYVRAVEALEKVFEPNTDFTKAWLLTWVAGAVDYPGDELGVIKKSLSLLESAVLRDPNHFAARKRLLQNQDYLTAVTCLRQAGYSDSVAKTGTGWGERRRIAENLLSQVPPQDPLFYQALLNQGRIFYWVGQKSGSSHEFTKASACFLKVQEVFPGSALVRMYLGERLPWGNTYREPVDNAPAWAQRQREALARINDIIGFWMDRRQEASGEFGGGWGDDVEMMRWWAPAAFVTGSDKVTESMTRLADGLWTKSGIIADGFFRGVAEVQYAAEPTSDTLPAMMALKFGDPVYVERCLATGYLMDSLWTNFNPKGHRLFKSVDLGSRGIGQDTKRALDVPYHARAVLPAHWAAWYARSPRFLYLFREWADSWVAASQRKDKNKPPGVPPAAIAFATEELGGYEATWFNPKLGPIYYNFPGGVEILFEHLLATYQLTREDKYLIPIESCLALLRSSLDSQETKGMVGGSQWVARVLQSSDSLGDVWSKWRLLSGKRVFDDYLKRYGSPYVKWYLTGDKRFLVEGCQTVIGSIDHNFELLTSEVRYTDRVKVSGVPHLLAMGTGGPGLPNAFPCWKVTWQTHTKNFAALVLQEEKQPLPGDQTSVRALAYNFESDPLNVQVWLWSLMPGRYEMAIGPDTDGDDRMDFMAERSEFSVYERSTPISFVLPPDALYEVAIRQLHVFRAIREQRPDLAVSLGDMHIFPSRPLKGERVFVMARVHNIGGTEAPNVRVSLLSGEDAETTELATRRWVSLDAPKDLQPRTAWIWADVPMHAEEAHFRVRAEMAGANPGDELTLRNNQAVRDVRAGDKPNTRFEEIFSRGKLNERMVPPWVELAQVLEGETILSDVSIQRLGESLSAAAVGAGEDEMRMIGNLAGYLKELAERREVSESGGTDGRGVNQPPSRQLEPGQGPESGPPKQ